MVEPPNFSGSGTFTLRERGPTTAADESGVGGVADGGENGCPDIWGTAGAGSGSLNSGRATVDDGRTEVPY